MARPWIRAYNEDMLKESREPVRELRSRISKELAIFTDLEATFESPYFRDSRVMR